MESPNLWMKWSPSGQQSLLRAFWLVFFGVWIRDGSSGGGAVSYVLQDSVTRISINLSLLVLPVHIVNQV